MNNYNDIIDLPHHVSTKRTPMSMYNRSAQFAPFAALNGYDDAFIEKKPNYLYCDKKISYRRKGMITKDEQRYLKRLVELAVEREKYYTPLLIKTNEDIDYLKKYFNPKEKNYALNDINEIVIEEKILKLGQLINEYREGKQSRIKYNSIKNDNLGKEIKLLTKEIKKYLFSDNTSGLFNCKKLVNDDLMKLNNYFNELNKNNNIKEVVDENKIVNSKREYLDSYIFNSIVNHCQYKYNYISLKVRNRGNINEITIDDLIQEIASSNNYKCNDKSRRKLVLDNYFRNSASSSKFQFKSKMEKALKNINYENEKAKEEFSKLFNYDR